MADITSELYGQVLATRIVATLALARVAQMTSEPQRLLDHDKQNALGSVERFNIGGDAEAETIRARAREIVENIFSGITLGPSPFR